MLAMMAAHGEAVQPLPGIDPERVSPWLVANVDGLEPPAAKRENSTGAFTPPTSLRATRRR
jgi:hypothetical protein